MDKRQKQVFRLVTLLPAFPAVASGTRGGSRFCDLRRRVRSRISRDSR